MALIKCPDCDHDISTEADACPNCGWKARGGNSAISGCGTTMTLLITLPTLLIFIFMGL